MNNNLQKTLTGNFVLLKADNIKLFIKQEEVVSIQHIDNDEQWHPLEGSKGLFYTDKAENQFFVFLANNLKPSTKKLDNRLVSTTFFGSDKELLWCWDNAQIITDVNLDIQEIPDFAMLQTSPVKNFVVYEGEAVFICTAKGLIKYALKGVV